MYAQLVEIEATPELERLVADELVPALLEQAGFAGTLALVDRETGRATVIALWETAEQARRELPHAAVQSGRERVSVCRVSTRV